LIVLSIKRILISKIILQWSLHPLGSPTPFYASEYGEEVFLEDMEEYAFREILSCRSTERAYLQNLALLLEDEEQEIINIR